MQTPKYRYLLFSLFLLAALIWAAVAKSPDKNLHLYFLDVGQGDSILVRTPSDRRVLIDGGPDNSVMTQLGEVLPPFNEKIEIVILTHPDADHLTGLIPVLEKYQVEQIWSTGVIHTTNEYLAWLNLIKSKYKDAYRVVYAGTKADLGDGVNLEVLWPEQNLSGQKFDNNNNTSVVTKISYQKFSALLPGDAQTEVQEQLLKICPDLRVDILKAPHHGSNNGVDEPFLNLIKPKLVVISVGAMNKYGHPNAKALELYKKYAQNILRTDQNGRIEVISNGQNFWTKRQK